MMEATITPPSDFISIAEEMPSLVAQELPAGPPPRMTIRVVGITQPYRRFRRHWMPHYRYGFG